mmetsp:Transcript_26438/g.46871  ORF Transcript_26438/g.46871 Transcript_26438/m.46871 type:complete len:133 (-) Transcript_26438:145-543(-)
MEGQPPAKKRARREMGVGETDERFARLLKEMGDYEPTIPDAVVTHYLEKVGFSTDDKKIKRLIALATQKFLYEVITDAMQKSKIREKRDQKKRRVLQMEDLASSLKAHGINVVKPDTFVDSIKTYQKLANQQ